MNLPAVPGAVLADQVANYAQIEALPEHVVGEILDYQLHVQPRPAGPHTVAASRLIMDVGTPFDHGNGGPGGWWILMEPELHLGRHVLVPDLAGWRCERMPPAPADHRFTIVPDWVCEVLSPSTSRIDRITKMRIYAQQKLACCWLVDPMARTLEVFVLLDGRWQVEATFEDDERVRAAPFDAVELNLSRWWITSLAQPAV